jgi:hypothetical protein
VASAIIGACSRDLSEPGLFGSLPISGMTLENSPATARAPKISKTTPCKVAGGRGPATKPFDTSGKSGAYFDESEILHAPVAPQ